MGGLIHYDEPKTRDEIIASLESVHRQATAIWLRFPPRNFYSGPSVGGWSPAQNIEHLIKSAGPVALALRLPRITLRLLFGTARAKSRSFAQVRQAYRTVLNEGAQAGRFGPRDDHTPDNFTVERQRLLAKWEKVLPRLSGAIRGWDEASLDRYRLPHPLLGKLTVREMLYFTLFHLAHHAEIVAGR